VKEKLAGTGMKKPKLSVVKSGTSGIQPPRPLAAAGQSLWDRVQSDYVVDDVSGVEILCIACEAADRVSTLRAEIDRDGEIIRSRNAIKSHPGLRDELAYRAFIVRTLQKLGLNFEPVKAPGRPGQGFGWRPDNDAS
jgi:hypothetical protein